MATLQDHPFLTREPGPDEPITRLIVEENRLCEERKTADESRRADIAARRRQIHAELKRLRYSD